MSDYMTLEQTKVLEYTTFSAVDVCEKANIPNARSRHGGSLGSSWDGGSWKDMLDTVYNMSDKNAQFRNVMWENSVRIASETTEFKRKYSYRTSGNGFSVERVIRGVPECFRHRQNKPQKPSVDIVVNITTSCCVEKELMINRGAVIVALVDKMLKDYHVNLKIVVCSTCSGADNVARTFIVNLDCYPLDLDEVAFWVANPISFRRLWFGMAEVACNQADLYGYGRIFDLKGLPENTIYFPSSPEDGQFSAYRTIESSKVRVEEIVAKWNKDC